MRKITIGVIALSFIGIIGYDLVAAFNDTDGDTISEVITDWGYDYPIVAAGFGVLFGGLLVHWFWRGKKGKKDEEASS